MSGAVSSSRSMLQVNALLVATVGVGFLNNVAIAWLFGLTRKVDAYYAAMILPGLFMVLFVEYLGKNFLPVFARARSQSFETASELTSAMVTVTALITAVAVAVIVLASKPLFAVLLPGFDAAEVELVSSYLWIMAPASVLGAVSTFHGYLFQHEDKYTQLVAIGAIQPLVNLGAVLALGPFVGEYSLPIAFTGGKLIGFVLLARGAQYRYRPRITLRPEWERKVLVNSAILMGSGLLVRTRGLVGNYLASLLGEGAISALALGYKLVEPLERTTFGGVRMLMYSRTARLAVEENASEMSRLYRLGVAASFLLVAPPLAWMCFESEFLVSFLFERGAFDMSMTKLVALAVIGFAPSVLLAGVNGVLSNAFYALDRVKIPALVMPVGTVAYLAAAPFLYKPYGVLGLSLSPSAAYAVVFVLLLYFLNRRLTALCGGELLLRVIGYTALAVAAFGAAKLLSTFVEWPRFVEAVTTLSVGAALYFGVLVALRDRTLLEVFRYFRRAHPRFAR
ncbi:MAG TPA: lipid II flippase MurJ [Gammaproteobacteria bacterium]|nr:lipid II flippase MurJ [Gammaproteobacteria bacterium]